MKYHQRQSCLLSPFVKKTPVSFCVWNWSRKNPIQRSFLAPQVPTRIRRHKPDKPNHLDVTTTPQTLTKIGNDTEKPLDVALAWVVSLDASSPPLGRGSGGISCPIRTTSQQRRSKAPVWIMCFVWEFCSSNWSMAGLLVICASWVTTNEW